MNTIFRFIFTIACLLTTLVANAYKIIGYRTLGTGSGTITATYNSSPVVTFEQGGDITDIPSNSNVTLTITPTNDSYLEKIEYEYVIDLGESQARRRTELKIGTIKEITINSSYAIAHYGGNYSFAMPASDIVIYATFQPCTSISDFTLTLDGDAASKVYDGYSHTLTLKNGETTLVRGQDYTISPETYSWTNVFSSTPTLTGIGKYKGTKSNVTLSITQKPLTITAQAQTIIYGSSIQTGISKVDVTGLVTNDALTSITLTPSTSEVTNSGTITPSAATTTKGIGNYDVTYNTGLLIINPENLSAIDLSHEILDITLSNTYFNYSAGNEQKATVESIYYHGTLLASGTSYTYDYAKLGEYTGVIGTGSEVEPQYPVDYITPDIYTIVITFCGNYTGTKTVEYQIRPEITLNNVNGYRWRTFYEPLYNMEVVTDKFEACTVNDITTNSVTSGNRAVIKAGTPMLLFRKTGTASGIYPALIKKTDSRLEAAYWTGVSDKYKCKVDDNGVPIAWDLSANDNIMILVDDKFVRSKSGTLAAGKCYLGVSDYSSLAREFYIDEEYETTDIEEVDAQMEEDEYYDLSGRRVLNPTRGIYIMNGKKIIIK